MNLKQLLVGLLFVLPWDASAQVPEFDILRASWEAEEYAAVLPKLIDYWGKPGGRTWEVGYLIGTSECRIVGKESLGAAMLQEVLRSFPLIEKVRNTIADQLRACGSQSGSSGPT